MIMHGMEPPLTGPCESTRSVPVRSRSTIKASIFAFERPALGAGDVLVNGNSDVQTVENAFQNADFLPIARYDQSFQRHTLIVVVSENRR